MYRALFKLLVAVLHSLTALIETSKIVRVKEFSDYLCFSTHRIKIESLVPYQGAVVHARIVPDSNGLPGQSKIQLQQSFWQAAENRGWGANPGICRLVFHEYLRIMGIDDDQNAVSWRLDTPCDFNTSMNAQNMSFEDMGTWSTGGSGYLFDTDTKHFYRGKRSAFIATTGEKRTYGSLTQCVDATFYRSKKLRLTGYIRIARAITNGYAGLWARVDGQTVLAFDNMQNRGLASPFSGIEWTPNIVELPVSSKATRICFGALLTGDGAISVDELQLNAL